MTRWWTSCLVSLLACAHAPQGDSGAVVAVLDDVHDAAAKADEARYFGHFAADGVVVGTDAGERWDVSAFRAYAHPYFANGKAWSFLGVRRPGKGRGGVGLVRGGPRA